MIGEGIKKIPAYICKIPYDQLNELREKFWNSKKKYRRIRQRQNYQEELESNNDEEEFKDFEEIGSKNIN